MNTPDEKAQKNIFKVMGYIRQLQGQSPSGQSIKYKIGHFPLGSAEEIEILESLKAQGLITILDSYGSDSSR